MFLLRVCKKIKWNEGVLAIVRSAFTKNIFVQASLKDKIEMVEMLLEMDFVKALVDVDVEDEYLQSSGFIKQLKLTLYDFPYISVCWLVVDPLLESDFEYKRYINAMKLNFAPRSIEMLDSVNQVHAILEYCLKQKQDI